MRLVIAGILTFILFIMIMDLKGKIETKEIKRTYMSQVFSDGDHFLPENLIPQELNPWFHFSGFSPESVRIPFLPSH